MPCHMSVTMTLFSITQSSNIPSKQPMPCMAALKGWAVVIGVTDEGVAAERHAAHYALANLHAAGAAGVASGTVVVVAVDGVAILYQVKFEFAEVGEATKAVAHKVLMVLRETVKRTPVGEIMMPKRTLRRVLPAITTSGAALVMPVMDFPASHFPSNRRY